MKLSNNLYKALKWNVLIFLPALTSFLGVIGSELGWEFTQSLLTIMTAFTTFLGSLIGISSVYYHNEHNEQGDL